MQGPEPATDEQAKLRQELTRLRLKHKESTDRDIRTVLQMRIEQIEAQLPPDARADVPLSSNAANAAIGPGGANPIASAALIENLEDVPPPTPKQLQEADALIRQARVEKMRNNSQKATDLLKQAAAAAPGAPSVLEALGDDLMERKQIKAAKDAYQKAFRLNPKNVGVEEKLAKAALTMGTMGSLEEQMRNHLGSGLDSEAMARLPYAALLSAILPGAGHVVLGKNGAGVPIIVAWLACVVWFLTHWFDFVKWLSVFKGGHEHPNAVVFVPLVLMAIIYVSTLGNLKGLGGKGVKRKDVVHPKPPVDLPFD